MLSKLARADSIPGLEIEADDVRCTHGATAGQIPEEYIFYLMARGIDRANAERMIVQGFLEEVINRIPVEGVGASWRRRSRGSWGCELETGRLETRHRRLASVFYAL